MTLSTADKVLQALQSYGVKEEGKGKYRLNSPLRPGSNSHAFTVTIDDGEHGAFFDHVSGDKGSLYDLAKALNIDIVTPVQDSKRSYTGLDDYAAAHGIPGDVLRAAQWREVLRDNRPALEFPTKTGKRYRFLDGKKPYYKSQEGYKRCWYGLNARMMKWISDGYSLVICNGEISVVTAHHFGIPAACITSGEKEEIPENLLTELQTLFPVGNRPRMIIALDCDSTGMRAAKGMESQLQAAGFDAVAIDLELGLKGDLSDFCMLHGEMAFGALAVAPALPAPTTLDNVPQHTWKLIHASELKDLPTVEWLVEGEIPARSLTVLYGQSGIGKSFVSLDYALRIAQNDVVVYIAAEGESGYYPRIQGWCQHHNMTVGKLWMCLGAVNFFDREDVEMFATRLKQINPRLIVVDTLAMSMTGGDENSSRDMGLVLRTSRELQYTLKTAVLMVHHMGKQAITERGSSALRGAADSMIKVSPADELVLVESTKTKDAAPFPPRYIKLLPVELFGVGTTLVPVAAEQVVEQSKEDPLTPYQRKVLEVLSQEIFADGATMDEIAEFGELNRGSVWKPLNKMLSLGFVHKPGKSYAITGDGMMALGLTPREHQLDSFDSRTKKSKESKIVQFSPSDDEPDSLTPLTPTKSQKSKGKGKADPENEGVKGVRESHGKNHQNDGSQDGSQGVKVESTLFSLDDIPHEINHQYREGM